ncbi:hypothetical protein OF83DRAFT_1153565 [Amylostereum chailletii]|nr:hypothetical protein OF83DRAFT_1153565 [Amylostereum chailletii]
MIADARSLHARRRRRTLARTVENARLRRSVDGPRPLRTWLASARRVAITRLRFLDRRHLSKEWRARARPRGAPRQQMTRASDPFFPPSVASALPLHQLVHRQRDALDCPRSGSERISDHGCEDGEMGSSHAPRKSTRLRPRKKEREKERKEKKTRPRGAWRGPAVRLCWQMTARARIRWAGGMVASQAGVQLKRRRVEFLTALRPLPPPPTTAPRQRYTSSSSSNARAHDPFRFFFLPPLGSFLPTHGRP